MFPSFFPYQNATKLTWAKKSVYILLPIVQSMSRLNGGPLNDSGCMDRFVHCWTAAVIVFFFFFDLVPFQLGILQRHSIPDDSFDKWFKFKLSLTASINTQIYFIPFCFRKKIGTSLFGMVERNKTKVHFMGQWCGWAITKWLHSR